MVTRLSRRRRLQVGLTSAAALAMLRDAPQAPVDAAQVARPLRGVTFIPGDVRYWGRDPLAVLDGLLATEGLEVVRLPLYSWETSGRDGRWFFQRSKAYIERVLDAGKSIIPVVGIKQPGYPEVHLPWRVLVQTERFVHHNHGSVGTFADRASEQPADDIAVMPGVAHRLGDQATVAGRRAVLAGHYMPLTGIFLRR
ncbi:MAG: hypothetical protein EXR52_04540 [Dehalococcoidia bacterium]|nr:hypothetical protein [Dehalococcoidia bacterium]